MAEAAGLAVARTTGSVNTVAVSELISKLRELLPEIRSRAASGDREGKFPHEDLALLASHGFLALDVPAEHGGMGAGIFTDIEICRSLAKANSSTAQVFFVHTVGVRTIAELGNIEQQRRYFGEIRDRRTRIGVAASEPGVHVYDWKANFNPVSGGYLLNGTKHFCTGHEAADYIQVFAVLADSASLPEGVMLAMVPKSAQGLHPRDDWDAMGQRQTASGTIDFNDVFVPERDVLGEPGAILRKSPSLFGLYYQSVFSAIYAGIAEGAFDAALDYVRTQARPWPSAGIKTAVEDPYVLQHAGEMAASIEAAKALLERAGKAIEAAAAGMITRGQASVAIAQAKVVATNAALMTTSMLFQICGARSSYRSSDFDRYWRNARTLTLHDPVDYKLQEIGRYCIAGTEPVVGFYS
jgi:alkylation response protein AidB-like acyl-CoA dehydrogenase